MAASSVASWFETRGVAALLTIRIRDGARAPPHHKGKNLTLWPLVVNTLGLAERAFQRIGRDDSHGCRYSDGVLDEGRNLLGIGHEPAAVPALGASLGQDRHLVHPALACQFDDEMAAAPIGR